MLNRAIPFYNMILKCERYIPTEISLPSGFYFRFFQEGDDVFWAALEYAIGDFPSQSSAMQYFNSTYCSAPEELQKRCIFLINSQNEVIGSGIAWKDQRESAEISSLHWLVVSPAWQGKHLGLALCAKAMEIFHDLDAFPVYIHTQPWSYVAILLYIRLGFQLQITDTFANYENQYHQSLETLRSILPEAQFLQILAASENYPNHDF